VPKTQDFIASMGVVARGERAVVRANLGFILITFLIVVGCHPLPRQSLFEGSLPRIEPSAGVTGLVLTTSDQSYTSSDVYFYHFATGQLQLLATGESGDLLVKWQGGRLWLFNRSSGRVSFSHMSPRIGPSSRSVERRTPEALAGDPSDVVASSATTYALGLGVAHKLLMVDLLGPDMGSLDLGAVDTAETDVPFRPGVLFQHDEDLFCLHQQLSKTWKATGGGRLFVARQKSDKGWTWVDQNAVTAGTQGVLLNISNPVLAFNCHDSSCLFAGSCFELMGPRCVAGVDRFDMRQRTVERLISLPEGYQAAGQMLQGVSAGLVTACLKQEDQGQAEVLSIALDSGAIVSRWDSGAGFCGPMAVDQSANRMFVTKSTKSGSQIIMLDQDMNALLTVDLPFVIAAMELVNE
jgi:hypothetical protein